MSDFEQSRGFWDRHSDEYQQTHREHIGRSEPRWGMWQLPESELQVLGDVAGKDILELGCGAAQWSILLAGLGARPVGVDNSERQLEHARDALAAAGLDFPLVHAPAETVPLPDASFDIVFADHGANRFEIEDLREIQPPPAAESTYRTAEETEWARKWPMEQIWIVRKER